MRIAILYICTGKYNFFFQDFHKSCETFFYAEAAQKEYFVFTDNLSLSDEPNVHLIWQECRGFPMDSLFRFEMFLSIEEQLKEFEYIFFFNANMLFIKPIKKGFLPSDEEGGIAAVIHPGLFNKPAFLFPYERNKKSTAYIHPGKKEYHYYMGSLNGGKTNQYLQLIKTCAQNTQKDYDNGIIALVHDESHLNKYLSEHKCVALPPAYAHPEGWDTISPPHIIIRDKTKIDIYFNKGRDHSIKGKLKKAASILYRAIIWYL